MKTIVATLALTICQASIAGSFAGQPETGRTAVIAYANEVPSQATFPSEGHRRFRAVPAGAIECMGRTYVLEARQLADNPPHDESYLHRIMNQGRCHVSRANDKTFEVERFESYDSLVGRADLAYAVVKFTAEEAGGTPFSTYFYIDRHDITPAN
jgi:hypothetical protein